jgi:hypothetical protein
MRENARLRALGEGLTPSEHVNAILDELLNYGATEGDDVREVLADLLTNAHTEIDQQRKRIEVGTHIAQTMCQYFHGNADVFSYCAKLHAELSGRETHYGVVYERLNTENARLHDEVRQLRQQIEAGTTVNTAVHMFGGHS